MHHIFISIFIISLFVTIPLSLSAQIIPGIQNVPTISVSPNTPGPNEKTFISVESFSFDLDTSRISWFVDATLVASGVGEKVIEFTTEGIGSSSEITVVIETIDGTVVSETLLIQPTSLDIVWEAKTQTHPFYQGKAFPGVRSDITIQAIPDFVVAGKRLNPNDLIFSWRIDDILQQGNSGVGKDSITSRQSKPKKTLEVVVEVESPQHFISQKKRVLIPLRDAEIHVYENNPLLGALFNKEVSGTYDLAEEETQLTAYPFFMSLSARNDTHIEYTWKVDGKRVELGQDRGSIILNNAGGGSGESSITVDVTNTRDFFQKASKRFLVTFGTTLNPF